MTKITFKIEGLSELVDGLVNELPKATATNVQKRALTDAAEPIKSDAQRNAPRRTGRLQQSITISSKLSPRQKSLNVKESKVEIYVGPPSMPRAIVSEFGSYRETPRAFMRPAWDSNKATAFSKLKEILADEIDKARQRIARKAARVIAATKAS